MTAHFIDLRIAGNRFLLPAERVQAIGDAATWEGPTASLSRSLGGGATDDRRVLRLREGALAVEDVAGVVELEDAQRLAMPDLVRKHAPYFAELALFEDGSTAVAIDVDELMKGVFQ